LTTPAVGRVTETKHFTGALGIEYIEWLCAPRLSKPLGLSKRSVSTGIRDSATPSKNWLRYETKRSREVKGWYLKRRGTDPVRAVILHGCQWYLHTPPGLLFGGLTDSDQSLNVFPAFAMQWLVS
jgi:hypothetical protein